MLLITVAPFVIAASSMYSIAYTLLDSSFESMNCTCLFMAVHLLLQFIWLTFTPSAFGHTPGAGNSFCRVYLGHGMD